MSWRDDKHNVSLFFALLIFAITFKRGLAATDMISHSSPALQTSNLNSMRSNDGESASTKMLHIRQLLKSLILDWNFGESEFKGSESRSEMRTFGRMRMMKKIMLPLAFIGGFMTAIILGIKLTGAINMLLISKVLLLQFALILGKIIYGAKELFGKFSHMPQPYYIPVSHEGYSHGSSFAHSRDDSLSQNQQPNYYYDQRFPQAFNAGFQQQQPLYNQPINYLRNPTQNFQPQMNFGQPQSGPFSGVYLQPPQQVPTTQNHPQFSQPSYQDQAHNFESLESRLTGENYLAENVPTALGLIGKPQATSNPLSPQQMSQLLSDAIAQMSARATVNSISRRSPNIYRS